MDIQMPVMDGFEATASIGASKGSGVADLPVVAMTAYAMEATKSAACRPA